MRGRLVARGKLVEWIWHKFEAILKLGISYIVSIVQWDYSASHCEYEDIYFSIWLMLSNRWEYSTTRTLQVFVRVGELEI